MSNLLLHGLVVEKIKKLINSQISVESCPPPLLLPFNRSLVVPTNLYLTAHQLAKWARLIDLASSHTGLA